ncbi:hypothetical protein ACHAQH_008492 [Verticillium albo-atrum]
MALFFPAYTSSPEIIWTKMETRTMKVRLDHPELAQLAVECRTDPWHGSSSIVCNDLPSMQVTKLGHGLSLIVPVDAMTEGIRSKWFNKSVAKYGPPGHLHAWLGPLIFVAWHVDGDTQFQQLDDISILDYKHAVDVLLGWHLNPCIMNPERFEEQKTQVAEETQQAPAAPKTKAMKKREQKKNAKAKKKAEIEFSRATEAAASLLELAISPGAITVPPPGDGTSEASQDIQEHAVHPESKEISAAEQVASTPEPELASQINKRDAHDVPEKSTSFTPDLDVTPPNSQSDISQGGQGSLPQNQEDSMLVDVITAPGPCDADASIEVIQKGATDRTDEEIVAVAEPQLEPTFDEDKQIFLTEETQPEIAFEPPISDVEDEARQVLPRALSPRDPNDTPQDTSTNTPCYEMSDRPSSRSTLLGDDDVTRPIIGQQVEPHDVSNCQLMTYMATGFKKMEERMHQINSTIDELSRRVDQVARKGTATELAEKVIKSAQVVVEGPLKAKQGQTQQPEGTSQAPLKAPDEHSMNSVGNNWTKDLTKGAVITAYENKGKNPRKGSKNKESKEPKGEKKPKENQVSGMLPEAGEKKEALFLKDVANAGAVNMVFLTKTAAQLVAEQIAQPVRGRVDQAEKPAPPAESARPEQTTRTEEASRTTEGTGISSESVSGGEPRRTTTAARAARFEKYDERDATSPSPAVCLTQGIAQSAQISVEPVEPSEFVQYIEHAELGESIEESSRDTQQFHLQAQGNSKAAYEPPTASESSSQLIYEPTHLCKMLAVVTLRLHASNDAWKRKSLSGGTAPTSEVMSIKYELVSMIKFKFRQIRRIRAKSRHKIRLSNRLALRFKVILETTRETTREKASELAEGRAVKMTGETAVETTDGKNVGTSSQKASELVGEKISEKGSDLIDGNASDATAESTGEKTSTLCGDNAVQTKEEIIKTATEEIVDTATEEVIETNPEGFIETNPEEFIETNPAETIKTATEEIVDTATEEVIKTITEKAIKTAGDPVDRESVSQACGTTVQKDIETTGNDETYERFVETTTETTDEQTEKKTSWKIIDEHFDWADDVEEEVARIQAEVL